MSLCPHDSCYDLISFIAGKPSILVVIWQSSGACSPRTDAVLEGVC